VNFVKSNYIFLIWVSLYTAVLTIMAFSDIETFFAFLGVELASLIVAFSPAGEWLLRTLSGARKLKDQQR